MALVVRHFESAWIQDMFYKIRDIDKSLFGCSLTKFQLANLQENIQLYFQMMPQDHGQGLSPLLSATLKDVEELQNYAIGRVPFH